MGDHPTGSAQFVSRQSKLLEEFPTELWAEVIALLDPRDVLLFSAVRN
jgi:hypothetical protein